MRRRKRAGPCSFLTLNTYVGLTRTALSMYTPYITLNMVIPLPKIPYVHRRHMVLANPTPTTCTQSMGTPNNAIDVALNVQRGMHCLAFIRKNRQELKCASSKFQGLILAAFLLMPDSQHPCTHTGSENNQLFQPYFSLQFCSYLTPNIHARIQAPRITNSLNLIFRSNFAHT